MTTIFRINPLRQMRFERLVREVLSTKKPGDTVTYELTLNLQEYTTRNVAVEDMLPEGMAPRWYSISCAVYDVYIGALCYFPILRRS